MSLALRCGEKEKGGESMVVILQRGSLKTPILVGMEMYGHVWNGIFPGFLLKTMDMYGSFSGEFLRRKLVFLRFLGWCHTVMSGLVSTEKRTPYSWIFGEQRAYIKFP